MSENDRTPKTNQDKARETAEWAKRILGGDQADPEEPVIIETKDGKTILINPDGTVVDAG